MPRSIDLPGVMITLIVAGVVGFVGLQVMESVVETADLLDEEEAEFHGAANELVDAFDQAFGLIGVVFIVIILAVIIVYLYGLRGGGM